MRGSSRRLPLAQHGTGSRERTGDRPFGNMAWTSRAGAGDFLAKKPTQIGLYAGVTGAVRGARVDGDGRSAASSMQALQGCPVGEPEHLDARGLARSWPCRSALGLPLELSKLPSAGATASAWLLH